MAHAKILETRTRDQTLSDKAPTPCARQLNPADRDYYRWRADEEAKAARAASCCEARLAHEGLATAYRRLCSPNGSHAENRLASEQSAFLFDPKPAD
jgi:hypothetical protein